MQNTLNNVLVSMLFAALGFALLFVGYRIFDLLTPTKMSQRIFDDGNLAVAVLAGAFIIGLAIIIASAIS